MMRAPKVVNRVASRLRRAYYIMITVDPHARLLHHRHHSSRSPSTRQTIGMRL